MIEIHRSVTVVAVVVTLACAAPETEVRSLPADHRVVEKAVDFLPPARPRSPPSSDETPPQSQAERWFLIQAEAFNSSIEQGSLEAMVRVGATGVIVYGAASSQEPARVRDDIGGLAALRSWSRQAHQLGLTTFIDLQLNHVDSASEFVEAHPDWFHRHGPIRDFGDPQELILGEIDGTRDLAQENPEVSEFLIERTRELLGNSGVDGFLLRDARHVPLPFWQEFSSALGQGSSVVTIGEFAFGDSARLDKALRASGFSFALDMPRHFGLLELGCDAGEPERFAALLSARPGDTTRLVTFLDRAGQMPLAERCGDDEAYRRRLLTLQHALSGPTLLTPNALRCSPGLVVPSDSETDRSLSSDYECPAWREEHLRSLFEIRRAHPALRVGKTKVLAAGPAGLSLLRVGDEEVAVVLYNSSDDEPLNVPPPWGLRGSSLSASYGVESIGGALSVAPTSAGIAIYPRPRSDALAWIEPTSREVVIQVEGVPPRIERLTLVGDGEALGSWSDDRAVELRAVSSSLSGADVGAEPELLTFRTTLDLRRGDAFRLRLLATLGTDVMLERLERVIFVNYQRGPLELRWRWQGSEDRRL